MEQTYQLSAGALLYAVQRLHKRGFYGVPNVMPAMSDKAFPAFVQEAETELMESGCGMLSFDGEFTLDEEFAALLGACADCSEVIGASLHQEKAWQKWTLYSNGAVLERAEDFTCTLRPAKEPLEELIKALQLPEDPKEPLPETLVETGILEKRDFSGLIEAGFDEGAAGMILAALEGSGYYAHISHVEGRERTGELLLLYGPQGILSAEAEYSETQEFLRLRPVTKEDLLSELQALAHKTRV